MHFFGKFVPEIQITFLKAVAPSELKITSGLNPLCAKGFLLRGLDVHICLNRNSGAFVSSGELTPFQENLGKGQGTELPSPNPSRSLVQ